MPITFYPYEDDLKKSTSTTLGEKIEILLEAAERYKAIILDIKEVVHRNTPAEIKVSYNWDGLAQVLREVRELPEGNPNDKRVKGECLLKLAEIYEVLRAAKMQKLETVRLAIVNEANQLRSGT